MRYEYNVMINSSTFFFFLGMRCRLPNKFHQSIKDPLTAPQ